MSYVKNCLFCEKNMSITTFSEKTIKFTISHSFIIFYLFNWTHSLEYSMSIAVAEKKNSIIFSFTLLSLFLCLYACHSLSLSFFCSLLNFAKKEKLMIWLSHSMICSALFCYRVSFVNLLLIVHFCLRFSWNLRFISFICVVISVT